jgi:hypothetical protein
MRNGKNTLNFSKFYRFIDLDGKTAANIIEIAQYGRNVQNLLQLFLLNAQFSPCSRK